MWGCCFHYGFAQFLQFKAPNLLPMASWSTCPSCKMENRFWDGSNGTNWRKERRIEVFLTLMWSLEPKRQESMFACWCCGINSKFEVWEYVLLLLFLSESYEWVREGGYRREREREMRVTDFSVIEIVRNGNGLVLSSVTTCICLKFQLCPFHLIPKIIVFLN
jgi:hypothetical protein